MGDGVIGDERLPRFLSFFFPLARYIISFGRRLSMATVFISYRREETAGEARALFQVLVARLGEASVFMDVDTIALGRDFRQALQERLGSCDLLLALIGRGWVESKNASGKRRLEDPSDFVRLEIEAALKRNIPVTPVLVQGAQMPTEQQLPESIRDFVYRNGFELSHNRWESDVQEMLKRLGLGSQREPGSARETDAGKAPGARPPAGKPWLAIAGASVVVIGIVVGGVLYFGKGAEDKVKTVVEQPSTTKKRTETPAVTKTPAETTAATAGVKIEKAECANLGNGRFRLHLWGWASGDVGTFVLAGPKFSPNAGSIDESKITCLAWAPATVDDGPIHPRACKRTQGRPQKTPWSSQTTFQWRTGSPTAGFASTRGQPTGGTYPMGASDTVVFSCAVPPPAGR